MGTLPTIEERYSADELTSAMDGLHALSMATWRQLLGLVAEYDRSEAWRADGMTSMADWLVARYGLARDSERLGRISRALVELPAVSEAVGAGRLSADQAKWAVRLASPDTDEQVAADAPTRSAAELQAWARQRTERPTAEDSNKADGRRDLRWWSTDDGRARRFSVRCPWPRAK